MGAPIRDTRNILFHSSALTTSTSNMALGFDIDMADDSVIVDIIYNNSDKKDEMRGHFSTSSMPSSRSLLSSSDKSTEEYAANVQQESNNMNQDDSVIPSNSPQLKYATSRRQESHVSKVADSPSNMRKQCSQNITPALNNSTMDNNGKVFNIQLNYDINQALDPESWDGKFRAVSLHRSMEHLASDIKNIKELLQRIQRYILGKAIDDNKTNDIKDLKGVSKVA